MVSIQFLVLHHIQQWTQSKLIYIISKNIVFTIFLRKNDIFILMKYHCQLKGLLWANVIWFLPKILFHFVHANF